MRPVQVSRWRPFMGQITMSLDERNEILDRIKVYRERMNEINQFTQTVPDWAKVDPFQKAQPEFETALERSYKVSDQLRDIEARLSAEGPWMKLNEAEKGAFSAWQGGIDEMYAIYKAAKPDPSFDVRAAAAAGVVGVLFTIAIMGA
jgi:hypothetical protein